MSNSITTTTTTSLRWRARVHPAIIDSTISREEEDDEEEEEEGGYNMKNLIHGRRKFSDAWNTITKTKTNTDTKKQQQQQHNNNNNRMCLSIWQRILHCFLTPRYLVRMEIFVVGVVFTILYSATITNTWWMAGTTTIQLLLVLVFYRQGQQIQLMDGVQRQHTWLRTKLIQLWNENRTICRTMGQMDPVMDRIQDIQGQLAHIAVDTNIQTLMDCVEQRKDTYRQIQHKLCCQVQEEILTSVLATDKEQNYILSGPELERLLVRLGTMKGVQLVQEERIRELLMMIQMKNDIDGTMTPPPLPSSLSSSSSTQLHMVKNLFLLLRQIRESSGSDSCTTTSSPTENIFTFHPEKLLLS